MAVDKALRVPGILVIDPTDLSSPPLCGGSKIGDLASLAVDFNISEVDVPGYAHGEPVDKVELIGPLALSCMFKGWDDELARVLLPNTTLTSSSNRRITGRGNRRHGRLKSSRAVSLLFVPDRWLEHRAIFIPRAIPSVDVTRAMILMGAGRYGFPAVFESMEDASGQTYYYDILADLAADVTLPQTPATILGAKLEAWFDADDDATIDQDANGVSAWRNKASGNPAEVTQATDARKPVYNPSGVNGRATLTFDDSAVEVLTGSPAPVTAAPFHMFAVIKFDGGAQNGTAASINDASDVSNFERWSLVGRNGFPDARFHGHGSFAIFSCDTSGPSYGLGDTILMEAIEAAANDHKVVLNGDTGNQGSSSSSRAPNPALVDQLAIGAQVYQGGGSFTEAFGGEMCEVVISNAALTAGEISSMRSYLADKWGVTLV